jgi:hypothetical protein
MVNDGENILQNINSLIKIEDMPLTKEDKNRLRNCMTGNHKKIYAGKNIMEKYTYPLCSILPLPAILQGCKPTVCLFALQNRRKQPEHYA